jgi:hypothetical protein
MGGIGGLSGWKQLILVALAPFGLIWLYKRALTLRCIDMTNVGARWAAGILKSYSFDGDDFFNADGAPADVVAKRKSGFEKLGKAKHT